MDVVGRLDLADIVNSYNAAKGGQPPYDPAMMVSLLLYAYCVGLPSSRKIEKATHEQVPFRVIAADQHPDHDTVAEFRRRHLKALASLFVQVLQICQKAGLVKLGHVSLDGTKVHANASKHKAMSYGRMDAKVVELEQEVARLLAQGDMIDNEDDGTYGKGKRGDELPEDLRFKQRRLAKIKEAMAALEEEAKAAAQAKREQIAEQNEALARQGKKRKGKPPRDPDDKPPPKAQRNFTDSESRIMLDGATKAFAQSYNCQAAVDDEAQVIVATNVTQQTNDKQQVEPLIEGLKHNTADQTPTIVTADTGYFSQRNIDYLDGQSIDAYVAIGQQKHSDCPEDSVAEKYSDSHCAKARMGRKLTTSEGRATYSKRKCIVEPVFGQIKECRGLRRFSLRGLDKAAAEWDLICLTHNLLKLFRSGQTTALT